MSAHDVVDNLCRDLVEQRLLGEDARFVREKTEQILAEAETLKEMIDRWESIEDPNAIYQARGGLRHLLEFSRTLATAMLQRMNTKSRLVVLDTGKDR